MTEKYKKYKKIINKPQELLGKTFDAIKDWSPKNNWWQFARVPGTTVAFNLYLLSLIFTRVGLENKLIEKMDKNNTNKTMIKTPKTIFGRAINNIRRRKKNSPTASAFIAYYLLLLSLIVGGKVTYDNKENVKEFIKEWFSKQKENKKQEYNPRDSKFVQDVIDNLWEDIVIGLLEFETYYDKPRLNNGEKRYTYGAGLTWFYEGKEQYPCTGIYVNKAKELSDQGKWEQVRKHCGYHGECLSVMKKSLVKNGFKNVSSQQVLALLFSGYQTPARTPFIIRRLKNAKTEQEIVDAFIAGKEVKVKWRTGTNKRRWWCAMLYIGKITIDDFLNMDRDAFSEVILKDVMKDGHFLFDDATIQNALSAKKPQNGTVKDFIVSRHVLDNTNVDQAGKKDKVVSFNEGILKIKNKQKYNSDTIVFPFESEYLA